MAPIILDTELLERAMLLQRQGAVRRSLTTHGERGGRAALFLDNIRTTSQVMGSM
ncbi:hypothetical protein ACNKHQ_00165 [Shigella flexneri]